MIHQQNDDDDDDDDDAVRDDDDAILDVHDHTELCAGPWAFRIKS